jgi:hypothetical protein
MSVFAYILAAAAAPAPAATVAPPAPAAPSAPAELPPEITDGRMVEQIGTMVGALSRALLNLPVGELEAAVENRPPTRADKNRTVRSVTGMSERELDAEIEEGKVAVKSGSQAIARSLPVIVEALNKAGDEIERATANLPQPGYPKR